MLGHKLKLSKPNNSELLDLKSIDKNDKNSVIKFLKHYYYFNEYDTKGYLEHCKICYGHDQKYFTNVIRAEQL
jgi:hypothetical protein